MDSMPSLLTPPDPAPESPAGEAATADGFTTLDLDPRLLGTLAELGYEEPTPIQREAIPPLLAGRDLLAEAPTGTGKTAAFALPMLQRLAIGAGRRRGSAVGARRSSRRASWRCRSPRRSTATASELGARVLPVYGGQPIGQQLRGLRRGVDVVVATPGRAVDHLTRGSLASTRSRSSSSTRPTRCSTWASPRISRRSSRRRRRSARRRSSRPRSRRRSPGSRSATCATRRGSPSTPRQATGDGVARVRQVAYVVRRGDKLAALVPHPGRRGPGVGARLRPDPRRGRRPGRGAQRPRPRRRRAPRRPDAGAARPDHGALPRRQRSTSSSRPTSRRAASTSSTSRTS